jgi:hypothetical protein
MRFPFILPAIAALSYSSGFGQNQASPPPNEAVVYPSSGSHSGLPFNAGAASDARIALPPHPPMDEIPPIPIPEGTPQGPISMYRSMTYHDALTNFTQELRADQPVNSGEAAHSLEPEYRGVGAYDPAFENMFGFGTMSAATNHASFPQSVNVKLVVAFTAKNGKQYWFNCSGSMGDAGVVVTAAHCVYMHSFTNDAGNTINVFDFADIVYVYPAWDGNGDQWAPPDDEDVHQYWGYAFGTYLAAGTDYINNEDFDADCGLVGITRGGSRNVGMLTGWYGWTYGDSCSTIKSRTHWNLSFPGEQCSATLHTGRTMYMWNGGFDSCEWLGNEIRIDCPGNCLDSVWDGMSGSNAYYVDSSGGTTNRYVQAVCSNGPSDHSYGNYTELWGTFVTDMQTFEGNIRTSSEDWEPLMFRTTGSPYVTSGHAMDADCNFQMVNATNANPPSQDYVIRVYLSTNNNISSEGSDTLLATWTYNLNAGAMDIRKFIVPAPVIPSGTPADTYWLGVIVDSGLPGTNTNDDTDAWDAQQITVSDPALSILWWEDFESGGLTSGGWKTKNKFVKVNTKAAYSGTYGLRLKRKQWAQVHIPTTGYDSIQLKIAHRSSIKYDPGENFKVRWWGGSGWNDLIISKGDPWNGFLILDLPAGADNNPQFRLRFKSYGNAANEWGDVDNLILRGWK